MPLHPGHQGKPRIGPRISTEHEPYRQRRGTTPQRHGRYPGYDVLDHQVDPADAKPREVMRDAGWQYRSYKAMLAKQRAENEKRLAELQKASGEKVEPVAPAALAG